MITAAAHIKGKTQFVMMGVYKTLPVHVALVGVVSILMKRDAILEAENSKVLELHVIEIGRASCRERV